MYYWYICGIEYIVLEDGQKKIVNIYKLSMKILLMVIIFLVMRVWFFVVLV